MKPQSASLNASSSVAGVLAALCLSVAACSPPVNPGLVCSFVSGSSTADVCRYDYSCSDGVLRGVSCNLTECTCLFGPSSTPGRQFGVVGVCGSDNAAVANLVKANCASATPADGGGRDASDDANPTDAGPVQPAPTPNLDLLFVIDNSNSMRENQTNLMSTFSTLMAAIPAARSVHLGVVSTDLGTPGSSVPGCANSDLGDDGLLNPIRNGQALLRHEPWLTAPPTFGRPTDCTDANQFPSFITFSSGTTDPVLFTHDFQCNAGLYVNGCGLESQLDAVYRSLVIHDASDRLGNTSPNAGFLRDDAVLGIVMLTDEEDGSVRDCRFANGMPCEGQGAIDVYNPASNAWAAMELNLRFYMYQPCGPLDPNWPLERYVDPANPTRGVLALHPGHPERIVFAAITGVPLMIHSVAGRIDWDSLLGTPGGSGPDDFCSRDTSLLGSISTPEGTVSMQQANQDPGCSQRVVPACRREGSSPSTGCTTTDQYFAWPGRRIVEIARRFDESAICRGAPCRNGIVESICHSNYLNIITAIGQRIQTRLMGQ